MTNGCSIKTKMDNPANFNNILFRILTANIFLSFTPTIFRLLHTLAVGSVPSNSKNSFEHHFFTPPQSQG